MARPSIHFDSWSLAWRGIRQRLAPKADSSDCVHLQGVWHRVRKKPQGIMMQGRRYCQEYCLERALGEALRRARSASKRARISHRIPLGLLLLSRQQLSADQLQVALAKQRTAGRGKIGEWLQELGFVNEQQVTAALARQWSCPVLLPNARFEANSRFPQIPATLLRSFVMVPVDYVQATATLHIAFAEAIDYRVLYAIEQMTGCRTEPCMAVPSFVHQRLRTLSSDRTEGEIAFDRVTDAESSRIIRSYSIRVAATEIRLAACGHQLWVRLLPPFHPSLDLLLHPPLEASVAPSTFSSLIHAV
jgi:hypothetical protein